MEIERKYLITSAQLAQFVPETSAFVLETRYYLFCKDDNELRFTKRGNDSFTLDRMELLQNETDEFFVRKKERININEVEFNALVKLVGKQKAVERLHFKFNDQVELKIYKGRHEGLIRVEVEFESLQAANVYKPDFEYLTEITNTSLGRDVLLARLVEKKLKTQLLHFTDMS